MTQVLYPAYIHVWHEAHSRRMQRLYYGHRFNHSTMPLCHVLKFVCTVTKSMLLDSSNFQHQTRRLAISLFTSLPRVPVASALSSMSSFLLQSLISDGRTFRVTTGLSLLMAPARHKYDRLQGRRIGGGEGKRM